MASQLAEQRNGIPEAANEPKTHSNSWIKYRLLMWKNFLQQWRNRKQTLVEVLLPVVTMALILILRQQFEPVRREAVSYPPISADTLKFSGPIFGYFDHSNLTIAYSPESPVLEGVIHKATINLLSRNKQEIMQIILDRMQDTPGFSDIPKEKPLDLRSTTVEEIISQLVKIEAYNSSVALESIYSDENDIRKVIAAVEFDDKLLGFDDSWEVPENLSYALRFPEKPRLNSWFQLGGSSWQSDDIFPFFELPGPRFPYSWTGGNDPGYVNEIFIALQHVISMELVTLISGQDLQNFEVNLNRYPHPPYLEDNVVETLKLVFPLIFMLSFSYTAVNIIRTVTIEKEMQLKEIMKIMGLPTWLHWMAWFCKQFIYLFLAAVLILLLLKINWFSNEQGYWNYSVFTNTSWSVLLFYIVLYLTCTICFCFMISSFFCKGSTAALFGGIIWFISFIPAFLLGMNVEIPPAVQAIICLSINSAMSYGFQLLLSSESSQGMQWGDFFANPVLDSDHLLFGHVCIMLLVDCILYMLVALYFEQVLPGPFGTPQVWNFPFQKSFWFPSRQANYVSDSGLSDSLEQDAIVKENDPTDHQIGVKMAHLTKVYGSNTVVNNLSLNIYNDQITVLLGHNGAGKSTTISMLTGNVSVTRGTVMVAGYNITSQTPLARAHIGLCPQHNVLFNELTVREHLEFFARLKGYSGQKLNEDIDKLIDNLELQEKRHYNAEGLSGGQKRRLCVGIALCGGARVVLLDEPTSGMDPSSRRALWELLQREKKHRSMILTTHFMDEADYLGDRVAIMSSGKLQCVGSPYFLKQHYGVGYTMVIVKEEDFQVDRCTELIRKYIPDITVKQDRGNELTYSLPNHYSHLFEEMLNDLERNLNLIHYKNYGLAATTLEDVFLSVGSDAEVYSERNDNTTISKDTGYMENESDEVSSKQLHYSDKIETGFRLLWLHVSGIWLKLFWVSTRSLGFLLLQILVPIVIINGNLAILQHLFANRPTVISRPLTLSEGYISTETFLVFNGKDESAIGALAYKGYKELYDAFNIESMELTVLNNISVGDYYLEKTGDPLVMAAMRHKFLIGATFGDNEAVAWFSNFGYHDVATSLATVHSAILKGLNPTATLNVFNHPLNAYYRERTDLQIMVTLMSMQVASSIGNSLAIISAAFIMFYIKERVSRAKLLQRAAGVRPLTMWFAAALYDWFWFLLLCQPFIISFAAFGIIGLSTAAELARLILCLMVYGAAMLPLHYLISLLFNGPAIGFAVMFFVNVIFGLIGAQIVEALMSIAKNVKLVATTLDYVLQFFPLYSLVTATRLMNKAGLKTFSCMELCNNLVGSVAMPSMTDCTMDALCKSFPKTCCVSENIFEWRDPGILRYLVCTIGSCIVFWSLLMSIEHNLCERLLTRFRKTPLEERHARPANAPAQDASAQDATAQDASAQDASAQDAPAQGALAQDAPAQNAPAQDATAQDTPAQDDDVAAEEEHAQQAAIERGLVARGLTKYYGNHLAVDHISFTVNEAEFFGLLGAGKTTTFKMLMGDESVSSGDAYISGYSVRRNITKVHKNIGYCPQFDAVFGELTGRETIYLFSRFRGLKNANSSLRAESIARTLGFEKHLDKKVEQYSGGNKRKLSTGVSLLGGTRLVFVDEPTTGVDPAAKRTVWRALRAARRAGRAFVLTSHSMEECEALCDRLTVMVNGRFRCLGSPQHLKNKFSEGFTLTIKIRSNEDVARTTDRSDRGTDAVKRYVSANFHNVRLMEEYQGILTYYLPDRSVPWSNMFGIMERAKRDLDVEDYSILQTTLEQIFLQFTKYQQESSSL